MNDNILLLPPGHNSLSRYVTEFNGTLAFSGEMMWYLEIRHEPNTLTKDVLTWHYSQTWLNDRITNHTKNDRNVIGCRSNENCKESQITTSIHRHQHPRAQVTQRKVSKDV